MKVKNTSRRVIDLLRGKEKITTVPGSDEEYEVTDCPDVQWYIARGDLAEAFERSKSKFTVDDEQTAKPSAKQSKQAEK